MNNQNNKNENKEFKTREEMYKYLNKNCPKYFEGYIPSYYFTVDSKPIETSLTDILSNIIKSLKEENPQTEQEKTITKDEDVELNELAKKLSINMADKLKQGCYSMNDIINIYNANTTKEQQEECKKECYEALAKSLDLDVDNIRVIKINKDDSKETIKEKLNSIKSDNMQFNEDTGEVTLKSNPTKTMKQIDDEMQSNVGKQGEIINHPNLKDGCKVDIIEFSKDFGKYVIVTEDRDLTTYASYEQVEIIDDKKEEIQEDFEDILIEGYDSLINNYSILIKKDSAKAEIFDECGFCNDFYMDFDLEEVLESNVLEYIKNNYDNLTPEDDELIQEYLVKKLRCLYSLSEKNQAEEVLKQSQVNFKNLESQHISEALELIKLEEEMMD